MSRIGKVIGRARLSYANRRRMRRHVPPFLAVSLDGPIVEFSPPVPHVPIIGRWLPKAPLPLSLSAVRRMFERVAGDPRVRGVVLKLGASADAATYQALRGMVEDLRRRDKQVVAYAETFTPFSYYLACGCDRIIMPPSAEWMVLGFQSEYLFFKDALDRVGIGVDVVNVSPFKSAGDQFARSDFSEQSRAQAEWLLDARFDELVRGIARGRNADEARVRELIDGGPYGAARAVELGLIDAALYEDELGHALMPEEPDEPAARGGVLRRLTRRVRRAAPKDRPRRDFVPSYGAFSGRLIIRPVNWSAQWIGVVKIEGTIIEGKSQGTPIPVPLIGGEFAGAESVAACLRAVARDESIAALVLYVNSPGGSALASDLIAREVRRVKARKPVVACMGGVAASGGYYVSALANAIVAQPLTVTGSIGVISIKPNTQRAVDLLSLNRVLLKRGQRSGLFSDATPLSDDERAAIEGVVSRSYDDFKRLVAEGRGLDFDGLEPLCGGRVWTGAMALEHKLVDAMGDFQAALDRARELAKLPTEERVDYVVIHPPRESAGLFSLLLGTRGAADLLSDLRSFVERLGRVSTWTILPFDVGGRS